ncbi:hypothetical protein PsYK624_124440 [Phanerochaete sordida]|uniref:Uncharacterized protein n=1 Tax=Phanerochaete sordida TaxID=48140 RepID=A0A9P3LID4_9APHY|nr:hypothetical protein PsYK624_124440 [Phanerochaete sordida]
MSHQILPEIVDNIVDFVNVLPDDVRKLSLIICSQVSRNLNARSWHHLFRRIDITKGTRLREFLSIIGSAAFTNYVRELRLGRLWAQARTAAHTPKDDGICLDARAVSKLLATLLKLKQETLIIGRDVQWSPIQLPLRPTDSLSPPTSRVFIPIPIGSGTRRDIWAQKPKWAPPCGPFALRDAAANNREGVGFRMVEMAALPLSSGGMRMMSTEVAVPPEFVAAAEEVFLRIGDPGRVKAVDELVLKSMRNVPAVDIRWVAPDSLMSSNGEDVEHLLAAHLADHALHSERGRYNARAHRGDVAHLVDALDYPSSPFLPGHAAHSQQRMGSEP